MTAKDVRDVKARMKHSIESHGDDEDEGADVDDADAQFLLALAKKERLLRASFPTDRKKARQSHMKNAFFTALRSGVEEPQVILLLACLPELRCGHRHV
jgi:hypothetical protein